MLSPTTTIVTVSRRNIRQGQAGGLAVWDPARGSSRSSGHPAQGSTDQTIGQTLGGRTPDLQKDIGKDTVTVLLPL